MVKIVLADVFYICPGCKYNANLPLDFAKFVSDEKDGMVTVYGVNEKSIWFYAFSGYHRYDGNDCSQSFNIHYDIIEDMYKNGVSYPVNLKNISWDTDKLIKPKITHPDTR